MFSDAAQMNTFVEKLFGLEKANGGLALIDNEIRQHMTPILVERGKEIRGLPIDSVPPDPSLPVDVCLPWGLLYAAARKPVAQFKFDKQLLAPSAFAKQYRANSASQSPDSWMSQALSGVRYDVRSWGQSTHDTLWSTGAALLGV